MEINSTRSRTLEQLADRARSMSGWLRFMGAVTIGASIPSILSVVGIVFAWLPIWLGVLLIQAGTAARRGSDDDLLRLIGRLRLYFIVQSVVIVVSIVAFVLAFLFFRSILIETMQGMQPDTPTLEA